MYNESIASIFNKIADILEIRGDNPFRIRAYRRAAQNIEGLSKDVSELSDEELIRIPGIGGDLAAKIREFISSGKINSYEELSRDIPHGLLEMITIPGLGPKTAKLLYERLGIKNVDELEQSAIAGRLKGLPGIKAKTEENILKGIAMRKRHTGRFPIGKVLPVANEIIEMLSNSRNIKKIQIAGSLRRWKETVKDIDILATASDYEKAMTEFIALPQVKDVIARGKTKSSIITSNDIQVDLRVVSDDSFGAALAYFTGSKAHNIRLREIAIKKGLKINEYGIFHIKSDKKIGGADESDIYSILDMPFIPPELREDTGEIEAALRDKLPDLVEDKDIKGDLHVHSTYSDGRHDLRELARIAMQRGYKYIAVTDHSKGLGVASGMSTELLLEQNRQIAKINKTFKGFRLLSGVEVDIRSDMTLDYSDDILKKLDIVVASIHSGFRQSREKITGRLVAAMKNPYVNIIAHPTGRLIGERDAYDVDMEKLLKTARQTDTALEINAFPLRLDLNDLNIRKARKQNVMMSINTDAHVDSQFEFMSYGLGTARRGWVEKSALLNTMPVGSLMKWLGHKRS